MSGRGTDLVSYDGENLCRHGDVVVVTLNHRLGVFGFLNLAELGDERYACSANVGMLDLVAALEWVRDHIANFGGDPQNVMIFGQSGGGGKVNALMAMPAAQGLFHRAAVQSGSMLTMAAPEDTTRLAAAVLAELDVSPKQLAVLHSLPVERLVAAGGAAVQAVAHRTEEPLDFKDIARRLGWAPTMEGTVLPHHPFDPDAPAISAQVPLLVGTNMHEFTSGVDKPDAYQLGAGELEQRLAAKFGQRSQAILEAFRRCYPQARPFDLLSLVYTAPVRQSAVTQAERKAAQGAAPAYLYYFTYRTPVLDGRPGAFHSAEIAFVFDNLDRCVNLTGGDPEARCLASQVSQAWINFARTGDPNHPGLPHWPAFDPATGPVMVFDTPCSVQNNPDAEARASIG